MKRIKLKITYFLFFQQTSEHDPFDDVLREIAGEQQADPGMPGDLACTADPKDPDPCDDSDDQTTIRSVWYYNYHDYFSI